MGIESEVSVVTRTWDGDGGRILRAVEAISRQSVSPIEHIIVFHELGDRLVAALEAHKHVRLISDHSLDPDDGALVVQALNLGIMAATGKYIAMLGGDAEPVGVDWLATLLEGIRDPTVWGVYGRQIPRPNATPVVVRAHARSYPANKILQRSSYWFSNVNSIIRRATWEGRPFDPHSGIAEDFDFGRYVISSGGTLLYEPSAAVVHSHNRTLAEAFRRCVLEGKSHRAVFGSRVYPWRLIGRIAKMWIEDYVFFLRRRQFRGLVESLYVRPVEQFGLMIGSWR